MFRCPESGGELHHVVQDDGTQFLFCAESRLKYAIGNLEIPNFLVEDAERVEPDQVSELLERARATREGQ